MEKSGAQIFRFQPRWPSMLDIVELPVNGGGAREIIREREALLNEYLEEDAVPAPERRQIIEDVTYNLSVTLSNLAIYAKSYFRHGRAPSATLCAVTALTLGVMPGRHPCIWTHRDAVNGYNLLRRFREFDERVARNPDLRWEEDPSWRQLIFVRHFLATQDLDRLTSALREEKRATPVDIYELEIVQAVTTVKWPPSEMLAKNAVLLGRARKYAQKTTVAGLIPYKPA